jgi:hypothetical protein
MKLSHYKNKTIQPVSKRRIGMEHAETDHMEVSERYALLRFGNSDAPAAESFQNGGSLPGKLTVTQTTPNPYNGSTVVEIALPERFPVLMEMFDGHGARVSTLVSGTMAAGKHRIMWDADDMQDGVYYCRILCGNRVQWRKMVLSR